MAESGLRYTISQVRNVTGSARETTLTGMDDGSANGIWFNVIPGVASFNIRVYPYWSRTAVGTGVATLTVNNATVRLPDFRLIMLISPQQWRFSR